MKGQLTINGKDAYTTWGMSIEDSSIDALLTLPQLKPLVENCSPLDDGKEVFTAHPDYTPRIAEREVQMVVWIEAEGMASFLDRYKAFFDEIRSKPVEMQVREIGDKYRLLYLSSGQFTQFNGRLAKFVVKFNEPNPANRV